MNKKDLETTEDLCRNLLCKFPDLAYSSYNKFTWAFWREYDAHVLETYPLDIDRLTNVETITRAVRKIKNPKQDGRYNIAEQLEVRNYALQS